MTSMIVSEPNECLLDFILPISNIKDLKSPLALKLFKYFTVSTKEFSSLGVLSNISDKILS